MTDFTTTLGSIAGREAENHRASHPAPPTGAYVRTVGRRRAFRATGQGALAAVGVTAIAAGGVFLASQGDDAGPAAPVSPSPSQPAPEFISEPAPSQGPDSWSVSAWPADPPQPLDPATTSDEGWRVWSQYAASIASPICGQPYDGSLRATDSYYDIEGAVRNRAPELGEPFDFAARITNLSDVDLSAARWQGPLVMFLDDQDVVVAYMHLDPTAIEGPEYFDGPGGSFGPGESVEIFGRYPVVRSCPQWDEVAPYVATANPDATWPTTDTVPPLPAGVYEVVMQMSAPWGYDIVIDGVDISQELPPMKAVSLGTVEVP